jgi:hypothetical protein
MGFLKDASPRTGVMDLIEYVRQKREHNVLLWTISCLPIVLTLTALQLHAIKQSIPPPPTVTYFESWPENRTLEETMASITERQAEKDAFLEKKRQGYVALGRAMGMDVEEIEREAAQNRAETAKAADEAGKKTDADARASAGIKPATKATPEAGATQ